MLLGLLTVFGLGPILSLARLGPRVRSSTRLTCRPPYPLACRRRAVRLAYCLVLPSRPQCLSLRWPGLCLVPRPFPVLGSLLLLAVALCPSRYLGVAPLLNLSLLPRRWTKALILRIKKWVKAARPLAPSLQRFALLLLWSNLAQTIRWVTPTASGETLDVPLPTSS